MPPALPLVTDYARLSSPRTTHRRPADRVLLPGFPGRLPTVASRSRSQRRLGRCEIGEALSGEFDVSITGKQQAADPRAKNHALLQRPVEQPVANANRRIVRGRHFILPAIAAMHHLDVAEAALRWPNHDARQRIAHRRAARRAIQRAALGSPPRRGAPVQGRHRYQRRRTPSGSRDSAISAHRRQSRMRPSLSEGAEEK